VGVSRLETSSLEPAAGAGGGFAVESVFAGASCGGVAGAGV